MVIDKSYIEENKHGTINAMLDGSTFIYPTDTIYGIGCNALNRDSIFKIRRLKQREIKPFSIIAPNKKWITDNCEINKKNNTHLDKLPGPYTLFLKLKEGCEIPDEINPIGNGTIGVRIPKHWFTEIITEAGVPFVTTSANVSGRPYMMNLKDLDETIKNNVDFIIYEGEILGVESTKIDLTK